MVSQRVLLQERLETFCTNVYFQPPSKLNYPCILYSTDDVDANYGNNKSYILHQRWRLTVIEKNHEKPLVRKLIESIEGISIDREYITDNLYHTVLTMNTIY